MKMKVSDILPFLDHDVVICDIDDQCFEGYITNFVDEFEASSGKMEIEAVLGEVLLGIPIDEIKSIKYA